jgi:transposase
VKLERELLSQMVVGQALSIEAVSLRYGVTYQHAQQVLRALWRAGQLARYRSGRLLMYEGKQHGLKLGPRRLSRRPRLARALELRA